MLAPLAVLPNRMRALSAGALLLLAGTGGGHAASLPPPHVVDIPEANLTLHAQLYKPAGEGPFPAVIALHGCDGLAGHSERYRDWAEQMVAAGHAVLLPDSYGSRDAGAQCHVTERDRRVLARRERVVDINAARQWLLHQPWVMRGRISLVGWSNGASALLWAVRPQSHQAEPDFRSAVAFYPDCRISSRLGWSARVPTLLLIGANDEVSSPPACRQMVDGAQGRSALARIVIYPGAGHEFDLSNLSARTIHASADASASETHHSAADVEAHADSEKRVVEWLAR